MICFGLAISLCSGAYSKEKDVLDRYNVAWDSPSTDSSGSMPLGNGDIGLSLWVEEGGDLVFYISKTDAWSENMRLLKLGRVRVRLSPNPFAEGLPFRQELKLRQGEIAISAGEKDSQVDLRVWVDANRPVVRVEAEGRRPFDIQADLEMWRTGERTLPDTELSHSDPYRGSPSTTVEDPDVVLDKGYDRVVWCHHNARSCWLDSMKLQQLETLIRSFTDPLLNLTFGGAMMGTQMVKAGPTTLRSAGPAARQRLSIFVLTKQTPEVGNWYKALEKTISSVESAPVGKARDAHRKWWDRFWNRSWIYVSEAHDPGSEDPGFSLTRSYILQRYLVACGGRGNCWTKFNGSIFTLPWEGRGPDYRRWSGAQWNQNARLIYWPLIRSGDYDMLLPWHKVYVDCLPFAEARTKVYYGHGGAFFPETMTAWGCYANPDYGWDHEGAPLGLALNTYIRYHWQGGLEVSAMMLQHYRHTQDRNLLKKTVLPFASAVIEFYDKHYKRDENGKIRFYPAQSLETWQDAANPLPEIAGLKYVIGGLLALPADATTEEQRQNWKRILAELPDLPTREVDGKTILSPAGEIFQGASNVENPELYAVFPYRLFGVNKPGLDVACDTFARRNNRALICWRQDDIQMAYLGLTDQAAENVTARLTASVDFRFPAMWGPYSDEVPDMDHGGVGMMALQSMLLQDDGRKILLLPAWPKRWDVAFKLHAPYNTVVEGTYRDGKLQLLKVSPKSRAKDIVDMSR